MTSINDIKTSKTVIIPGWCDEAFECELRRPSILALAAKGAISNPLMKTARKIFYSGVSANDGNLEEESKILIAIAKAALVKPTFADLEEHGIELTDQQLIAIFQYTQSGAKALERFRGLIADNDGDIDSSEISNAAK